jgi:hypothetical protein
VAETLKRGDAIHREQAKRQFGFAQPNDAA